MSNPWMKFYPSDWRADQTLRICSLAARGLWIECMCIMHEAEPYGHLAIKGKPVTNAQLAILSGTDPATVATLLTELEDAGVFSKNRVGVIYSRRMTRDEKKRKDGEKSAKNGTLPNSRRGKQVVEKKEEKLPPTGLAEGVVEGVVCEPPSTQKPEARSYTEERPVASATEQAAPAEPISLKSRLFGEGLKWLASASEKPAASLRPMVGRWISKYGDGAVLEIFTRAHRENPVDPVAWIEGEFQRNSKGSRYGKQSRGNRTEDLLDGLASAFSDCMDTGPVPHNVVPLRLTAGAY